MAKFLSIKLIVMFTFYQSFVLGALKGKVLKATAYWTIENIKDGLNALLICVEMVLFSALMWWAYTSKEYSREESAPATGIGRPLLDSINLGDFANEILNSLRFFRALRPWTTNRTWPWTQVEACGHRRTHEDDLQAVIWCY